jgi:endonuclease/exonuclease/phosphatase family metal-dependent hydrolase
MNRQYISAARLFLFTLLFLFFLQLLTEFVAAIYAFGLLGTSIPAEIAAVLLLFSPLLLFLVPRGLSPFWLQLLLWLFLATRALLPLLDTRGRMLVAGVGVALFLFWLPAWLAQVARRRDGTASIAWLLGAGLLLAVSVSALLRAAGAGIDLTTSGGLSVVAWALVVVAALLVPALPVVERANDAGPPGSRRGWLVTVLLVAGLVAVLVQFYYGFAASHVIARWVGRPALAVLAVLALATAGWTFVLVRPRWRAALSPRLLWLLTLLFVLMLALTLEVQQVWFPPTPAGYPLRQPSEPAWHGLTFWVMLLLAPVLYADFVVLAAALLARRPSTTALAGAFSLASLMLLLLIFAHVFTTVYDYIPVVGPLFRDHFWLVGPLPGLVILLALLVTRDAGARTAAGELGAWALPLLVLLLGAGTVLVEFVRAPSLPEGPAGATLRVLTYNIQQGYDEAGERAYEEQLAVLREADADIIGLQETDAARIANGNDDLIRYFAGSLGYHSYYGPSPVVGTFGIALLSRTPLLSARTFYMYSEGEQTATIEAEVETETGRCRILVTHLGNGGPLVQQEAILRAIRGAENVVLMGDFNFRPETGQYALTTETLVDAWASAGGQPGATWLDPARRIDHIFVASGVAVEEARYLETDASDHPPLVAAVRCPGG